MTEIPEASAAVDFSRLLVVMRPTLHRYCARMTGSVIDGEDVVQDALLKAVAARASSDSGANPRAGLPPPGLRAPGPPRPNPRDRRRARRDRRPRPARPRARERQPAQLHAPADAP